MNILVMEGDDQDILLHLISNAQPLLYENKANHFKTALDGDLFLSGEWELGLLEYGYINAIDTITKDFQIHVGKIYSTQTLNRYLPHYLMEGGSQVKKIHIFPSKRTHPIDAFIERVSILNTPILQVKSDESSVYYLGSNGTLAKHDIYSIHFKAASSYELLDDDAARYVLILSPALAQSFQLDQCAFVTHDHIRIISKISASHHPTIRNIKHDTYWFSIVPLHRTRLSQRKLTSSKLGKLSLLEFMKQLEWHQLGRLTILNNTSAEFEFDFTGSLVGIQFSIFKSFLQQANVTMELESIEAINISIPFKAISSTDTKQQHLQDEVNEIRLKIQRQDIKMYKNKKTILKLRKKRKKLYDEYNAYVNSITPRYDKAFETTTRLLNFNIANKFANDMQAVKKSIDERIRVHNKEAEKRDEMLAEHQAVIREQENYYSSVYEDKSVSFLKSIPMELDLQLYVESMQRLIDRFEKLSDAIVKESVLKKKYSKDLHTFSDNNSILIEFTVQQSIVCQTLNQQTLTVRIPAGFYTIPSMIQTLDTTIQAKVKKHGLDTFCNMTTVLHPQGFHISVHLVGSSSITLQTAELIGLFPNATLTTSTSWTHQALVSDLRMTKAIILKYASDMDDLIDDMYLEEEASQIERLRQLALHGNNVLHLSQDAIMFYYFHDPDTQEFHKDIVTFDQCMNQGKTACGFPFHLHDNIKNPIKVHIPEGFYTPYTLAETLNENLPFHNFYWFTTTNDDLYYNIHVKISEGAFIRLEDVLLNVLKSTDQKFKNGHIFRLLAPSNRVLDQQISRFPFVDELGALTIQHTPKPLNRIQNFMFQMFHIENESTLHFNKSVLTRNFQVGLLKNDKQLMFFIPGLRLRITCENLMTTYIPNQSDTPFLQYYSSDLTPRQDTIFNMGEQDFLRVFKTVTVPRGQYTIETLINCLQRHITPFLPSVQISLNPQHYLTISTGLDDFIDLRELQPLLNLKIKYVGPDTKFKSTIPVEIIPNSYNIIIYCNLVNESIVGGQRERILRIIPTTKHKVGEMITEVMTNVDYYRMYLKHIKEIEISFRGDDGDYLPIRQGRSYVKLHLRRGLGKSNLS